MATGVGLVAGAALDWLFGDPRRFHPVAGYGRAAAALERRLYAPTRRAGARYAAVAVGAPVVAAALAQRATRGRPLARAALVAGATWAVLGGRSLRREATAMADALDAGDLAGARRRLPSLCGRDPSALDAAGLARATVESVAENTSDAVVAPLYWGAVAGLPGLVGYRAVNTLDAMVGHRSPRYRRFGTAAARLDDVANLVPARLTAALTVASAPLAGGSRRGALRAWLRDGDRHPSPNSGRCEAAMAGALGVRLGGRNIYAGRVEDRPRLGDGQPPAARDIHRAARLSAVIGAAALALTAGHLLATHARRAVLSRLPKELSVTVGEKAGQRAGGPWELRTRLLSRCLATRARRAGVGATLAAPARRAGIRAALAGGGRGAGSAAVVAVPARGVGFRAALTARGRRAGVRTALASPARRAGGGPAVAEMARRGGILAPLGGLADRGDRRGGILAAFGGLAGRGDR